MARKLGRKTEPRLALIRSQVADLFIHERIKTTESKAKEVRSMAEKMITLAKRGDLHARRQVASFVYRKDVNDEDQNVIQKLFDDIAPRFEERQGGYTRILKLGPRRGDGAPMVFLELVE